MQEIDINYCAPIRVLHHFLPLLKRSSQAVLVNVSSGLAYVPSIQAGRLKLERINILLDAGATFAFETTLATKSYVNLIRLIAHGDDANSFVLEGQTWNLLKSHSHAS